MQLTVGTGTTSSVAGAVGGSVPLQQFKFLHGQQLGAGPVTVALRAQRTAGTGNINVSIRSGAVMVDPANCTATGL